MKFLTAVALVMLWVPVDGVAQRNPLTGLSTMGQQVSVQWNALVTRVSEESFTQEAERALELGLLRSGIPLSGTDFGADGQYLECDGHIFSHPDDNGRIVSHTYQAKYWERVRPIVGGGSQYAITWSRSGLASLGVNNLSGTDLGEWCAETFELEWRRANN